MPFQTRLLPSFLPSFLRNNCRQSLLSFLYLGRVELRVVIQCSNATTHLLAHFPPIPFLSCLLQQRCNETTHIISSLFPPLLPSTASTPLLSTTTHLLPHQRKLFVADRQRRIKSNVLKPFRKRGIVRAILTLERLFTNASMSPKMDHGYNGSRTWKRRMLDGREG